MSFNIDNKLISIDFFQFLIFSLDILVKNLSKNSFKYLSEEFNSKVLDFLKKTLWSFFMNGVQLLQG